jgi:hypothetical protein
MSPPVPVDRASTHTYKRRSDPKRIQPRAPRPAPGALRPSTATPQPQSQSLRCGPAAHGWGKQDPRLPPARISRPSVCCELGAPLATIADHTDSNGRALEDLHEVAKRLSHLIPVDRPEPGLLESLNEGRDVPGRLGRWISLRDAHRPILSRSNRDALSGDSGVARPGAEPGRQGVERLCHHGAMVPSTLSESLRMKRRDPVGDRPSPYGFALPAVQRPRPPQRRVSAESRRVLLFRRPRLPTRSGAASHGGQSTSSRSPTAGLARELSVGQ